MTLKNAIITAYKSEAFFPVVSSISVAGMIATAPLFTQGLHFIQDANKFGDDKKVKKLYVISGLIRMVPMLALGGISITANILEYKRARGFVVEATETIARLSSIASTPAIATVADKVVDKAACGVETMAKEVKEPEETMEHSSLTEYKFVETITGQ